MVRSAVLVAAACTACHVIERVPDLHPGDPVITVHEDRARALPPALTVTTDGRFRLVEPRLCPTTEVVEMQGSTLVRTKPNYATFVVGAILTSLGGIGTAVSIGEGHPQDHPLAFVSPVALGVGLVFAIGPFVGNHEDRTYDAAQKVERNGVDAPCGDHPLAARSATLTWRGLRAVATVDGDGYLSTSPFELVDAFSAGRGPAFDVGADVTMQNGDRHAIQSVIAGAELVKGRDAYLARIGVDGRWEQLRKVPRVEAGAIRASRTTVGGHAVLRVVLPLDNNGPGDAWQVRGEIATQDPEVDGRTIYVGHLAPHGHAIATLDIPLSDESDRAITDSTLELAITLIDADATTSAEPARFKGQVLQDVPR